jgi:hypothetical protein
LLGADESFSQPRLGKKAKVHLEEEEERKVQNK